MIKNYQAVLRVQRQIGVLWAVSGVFLRLEVIFLFRSSGYHYELGSLLVTVSSQTINLLDGDSELGLMSAVSHSRFWNGYFDKGIQDSMSSLLHLLRATDLGFKIFR